MLMGDFGIVGELGIPSLSEGDLARSATDIRELALAGSPPAGRPGLRANGDGGNVGDGAIDCFLACKERSGVDLDFINVEACDWDERA